MAFCEIEPFPQKVLKKHWPGVPIYDDIRELTGARLAADGITVDVITGGFPCQDISFAGRGAGLAGERSGLFYEIARLIGELAPRFIIVENSAALLSRGLDSILGALASLGYDAVWNCIQAGNVGAAHIRDRLWIAAYIPNTQTARFFECWREQFKAVCAAPGDIHTFRSEPEPPRVAYGVPDQLDRVGALGNAVVPQIPELIGRAILEHMEAA